MRSARRNVRKCLDLGFEPSVIGHPAAVHQLGRSGDVRARVGGQEDDRAGDLGRLRPALQRRLVGVSIPSLGVSLDLCGQRRFERPRHDGVDAHPVTAQLGGHRLGQLHHPRLGRRVKAPPGLDDQGTESGKGDDAALPRVAMAAPNARLSRYVPLRLRSITLSKSSSVVSRRRLRTLNPGVTTRISASGCAAAAAASTLAVLVTSIPSADAVPPPCSIWRTVSAAPSVFRSAAATAAPLAASPSALVRPHRPA